MVAGYNSGSLFKRGKVSRMACYVHERSELNAAGPPGFGPGREVLETPMLPLTSRPYAYDFTR